MLLDTSGLLCLHNRAEPFHAHASTLYHTAHVRLTHSYVLAEFVALAHARRLPRMAALAFMEDLVDNPDIDTVWVDEALHRDAMALLLARLTAGVRRQSHKEKTARQAQRQGVDSSLRCRESSQSEEGTHEPDIDP